MVIPHNNGSRGPTVFRPWVVLARTGFFVVEVVALGCIMSFLTEIENPFTPYFSIGKRSHYFLTMVSVALSMLINASGGVLTFLNKFTGSAGIATAVADLVVGILAIATAITVFSDGDFIFNEQPEGLSPRYPSMRQRKTFAGMPLIVGQFHVLTSLGVFTARFLSWKTSNTTWSYEELNADDNRKDVNSRYEEEEVGNKDVLPAGTATERTPLLLFPITIFGYLVFYIALLKDPFGGQLRIRQFEAILTTLSTVLLNLVVLSRAYHSHAKLTVRTVTLVAFLDMILGSIATLTSTYFFFPFAEKVDRVTGCWHHGESENTYVDPCEPYAVWKEVEMWTNHYRQTWWYIASVFSVSVFLSWVVSLIAALCIRERTGAPTDKSTTIYDVELTNRRRRSTGASAARVED
ncbi:hypothetical protein QBC44DRAFT_375962 [Cladorrhinum sp. PSN332]|nr:hypothetical protein QBC44DRAFT_375962 [Cladorrhinum sp. PSN332]